MGLAHNYVRGSIEQRFWSKVRRSSGCWEWQASLDSRGYGNFGIPRNDGTGRFVMARAHRVALKLSGQEVPDYLVVMHTCDNRKCCNPDHLKVATQSDNMRDCFKKNRATKRGEANGRAKLTNDTVVKMRNEKWSIADAVRLAAISKSTASAIINGRTWKHV